MCGLLAEVVRRSHNSAPPPPQITIYRGQHIHTAISLHDLRDASLENPSGLSFEMRNSNYANLRDTHRLKYRPSIDP